MSLKMLLGSCKRAIVDYKYKRMLPKNPMVEDVYIVSYPKSGNTWLRFLIANAIKVKYDVDREVTFFTIQDIIPGIAKLRMIKDTGPFEIAGLPRIITSHSHFNPYMGRVILLVRDPRDVLLSHFYHSRKYGAISESLTLDQFIRTSNFGVQNWNSHTSNWMDYKNYSSGQIVRIFKYEDLKTDTANELKKIMNLIGLSLSDAQLTEAIQLSSFENMAASEKIHMSSSLIEQQETNFVRVGKATAGDELKLSDKRYIEKICYDISKEIGYWK
jgi:hypothetical protein